MACYHPISAWRGEILESGKRSVIFDRTKECLPDSEMSIPCGQCIGCRLERSRQWALRCVHEAALYQDNCFITLTYNDENLPKTQTLVLEDVQKFWKRLRKHFKTKQIRYYLAGEYGELTLRPHYHACVFGFDFKDKILWSIREGNKFTSHLFFIVFSSLSTNGCNIP